MTASTAKQEVNRMPRGTHPNSLANLKKGHRFSSADDSARENAKKASSERRSIAEEMKALLDEPNKDGVVQAGPEDDRRASARTDRREEHGPLRRGESRNRQAAGGNKG